MVSARHLMFALALTSALGLGILLHGAGSAHAVPPTLPGSLTGSTTTTTAIKLGREAQSQVDALTVKAQAVQAEIAELRAQVDQKIDEYYACLDDLRTAGDRLGQLRREVDDARAKKAGAQAALDRRIRAVYISGGRDQLLQLLLLSGGLEDLYNRVRLVKTLAGQDQRIVSDLRESSERLALLLGATDDQRRDELSLRRRLSRQAGELQTAVQQKEQALAGLDDEVRTIVERERQRQLAERARLEAELQARLQAARERLVSSGVIGARGANVLSAVQIARIAQSAGFTGRNLVIAVAVALAESGGNTNAVGDVTIGGSFGLWQVYCMAHPDKIPPANPDSVAWYDPHQNARWAYQISGGGGNWRPWSTFKHGTYQAFMDRAQDAVVSLITAP